MPIKHLESKSTRNNSKCIIESITSGFLLERKQLQSLQLNILSESRLGIDAAHYLQQLLESPNSKEPLLAATGGLPLALSQRIEADLRVLEKLHIKPVFVFPGLQPNKKWRQSHHYEYTEACRDRRDAWAKYENGQEDAATKLFEGRHGLAQWDLWRMVLRIFRNRNVEFIVAPYVAWAQVCYLRKLGIQVNIDIIVCHSWSISFAIPRHTSIPFMVLQKLCSILV